MLERPVLQCQRQHPRQRRSELRVETRLLRRKVICQDAMSRRYRSSVLGCAVRRLGRKHVRLVLMVNCVHCVVDRQVDVREPHTGSNRGLLCICHDRGGSDLVPIDHHVLRPQGTTTECCCCCNCQDVTKSSHGRTS